MAAAVPAVGDYELQVSLSEALCRLTPRRDRRPRAEQWFANCDISRAFCGIKDADFEVDCRHFLNFLNRCHGNQRRVHTFPCLRAFLDSTQLFPPRDEKLEEFWIDFNLGSECVSFFIDEPERFLWGSIHLLREEVNHYNLQLHGQDDGAGARVILSVHLHHAITHLDRPGKNVQLLFPPQLLQELEKAAQGVFKSASKDDGGSASISLVPADASWRSYPRKKRASQLTVLPLSSPSRDEEVPRNTRTEMRSRSEILFDQIRDSTASYESGVPVEPELEVFKDDAEEVTGSRWESPKEIFIPGRKRAAQESGYLSDSSPLGRRRKTEPLPVGSEGSPMATTASEILPSDWPKPTEGAGPSTQEVAGPSNESGTDPEVESESDIVSSIGANFRTFKQQLEQHFTGLRQKLQADVIQSLERCQQHMSTLLTTVHQHRLDLLQTFENNIVTQLTRLEESSAHMDKLNSQIQSFFKLEMQQLRTFCDQQEQRLKTLREKDVQQPAEEEEEEEDEDDDDDLEEE